VKPDPGRFLQVAAAHLLAKTAPALGPGYEQSTVSVLSVMLLELEGEFERAAARRVEENRALRVLFADAAGAVEDAALGARLREAAAGGDASLLVHDLERSNAALRGLLIELHAHVETLGSAGARRLEAAIWRELVASTERRRLLFGPC
jgi:hypothetical protein